MPSYYYTKFQKNPCVGRNERCPLLLFEEENTADRIMKLFQAIPFAPFDKYVKTVRENQHHIEIKRIMPHC